METHAIMMPHPLVFSVEMVNASPQRVDGDKGSQGAGGSMAGPLGTVDAR